MCLKNSYSNFLLGPKRVTVSKNSVRLDVGWSVLSPPIEPLFFRQPAREFTIPVLAEVPILYCILYGSGIIKR
jgi:hypothetical protein